VFKLYYFITFVVDGYVGSFLMHAFSFFAENSVGISGKRHSGISDENWWEVKRVTYAWLVNLLFYDAVSNAQMMQNRIRFSSFWGLVWTSNQTNNIIPKLFGGCWKPSVACFTTVFLYLHEQLLNPTGNLTQNADVTKDYAIYFTFWKCISLRYTLLFSSHLHKNPISDIPPYNFSTQVLFTLWLGIKAG
jgi:hypothetical protein